MIFTKSININTWKAIREGYEVSTKHEGGRLVIKPKNEWIEENYKNKAIHAKVMNAIMYFVKHYHNPNSEHVTGV